MTRCLLIILVDLIGDGAVDIFLPKDFLDDLV